MRFEVPLLPDDTYVSLLAELGEQLEAVHFAVSELEAFDARQQVRPVMQDIVRAMKRLPNVPAYLLLNGNMLPPQWYCDKKRMAHLAEGIEDVVGETGIRGIVFADWYLMNALSDSAPGICERLEAVPSVNTGIHSPGRAQAVLDVIEDSAFQLPTRVVLDRALNRDRIGLGHTVETVRNRLPGVSIVLLANEGCLPHCPFKRAHDAHIGMVNAGLCEERTYETNRRFACLPIFHRRPERIFASPFIRPEDAKHYEGMADVLKLCGRTRGPDFMSRVLRAYRDGVWHENLLELLDVTADAAPMLFVDNKALSGTFLDTMMACGLDCASCGFCGSLERTALRRRTPTPGVAGSHAVEGGVGWSRQTQGESS